MKCHINIYINKCVDDYVNVAGNVNKLFLRAGKFARTSSSRKIFAVNKYMQYGCINNTGMKKA